jgi:hypothetical protein
MDFKLGQEYRVTFHDHFSTTDKAPEAIKEEVVAVCWGRCVGVSKKYVMLSHFWINDSSDSNDNIHILKADIIKKEQI